MSQLTKRRGAEVESRIRGRKFCTYYWGVGSEYRIVCSHSTRLLAATTLRNVLGTKNLAEILSERESISHVMQTSLDDATDPWGVKVERVEM